MIKNYSSDKAITLIALVITIVILIILAGVAISITFGENGIISRAKYAQELSEYMTSKEKIEIKLTNIKIECEEEKKKYDLQEIIKHFESNEETEVIIEQYIYEKVSAVRHTAIKKDGIAPKGIAVTSKEIEKYKFLIDEEGEIKGVTKEMIDANSTIESFTDISIYESKNGNMNNNGNKNPTPTPTPTPIPDPMIGKRIKYQNRYYSIVERRENNKLFCLEDEPTLYYDLGDWNDEEEFANFTYSIECGDDCWYRYHDSTWKNNPQNIDAKNRIESIGKFFYFMHIGDPIANINNDEILIADTSDDSFSPRMIVCRYRINENFEKAPVEGDYDFGVANYENTSPMYYFPVSKEDVSNLISSWNGEFDKVVRLPYLGTLEFFESDIESMNIEFID